MNSKHNAVYFCQVKCGNTPLTKQHYTETIHGSLFYLKDR